MAADAEARLVGEIIEAFNRADRARLIELTHEDFELLSPLAEVRGSPYRGHEGAERWGDDLIENFARFVIAAPEIEQIAPGRLLATGSAQARGRSSGIDYEQPLGLLFDVRDERMSRLQVFFDPDEARSRAKQP